VERFHENVQDWYERFPVIDRDNTLAFLYASFPGGLGFSSRRGILGVTAAIYEISLKQFASRLATELNDLYARDFEGKVQLPKPEPPRDAALPQPRPTRKESQPSGVVGRPSERARPVETEGVPPEESGVASLDEEGVGIGDVLLGLLIFFFILVGASLVFELIALLVFLLAPFITIVFWLVIGLVILGVILYVVSFLVAVFGKD
jgi:hypothetical protein